MTEEIVTFGLAMFFAGTIVGIILRSALARQDSEYTEYLKMRVRDREEDMKLIERWEAYKKADHASEKEDSNQKGE